MDPASQARRLSPPPVHHAATLQGVLRLLFAGADREVWFRLAGALLVVGAGGLLTALAPLALKSLVDGLAAAPTPPSAITRGVLPLALLYVAALCAGRFVAELRPLLLGAAEQRLRAQLSRRFVAHVVDLPMAFHLEQKTGSTSHSLAQASSASQLVLANLVQGLPLAVELVTVIVVLTHLGQPALATLFVASAAAYAVVFRDGTARIRRRSRQVSACTAATQATVADALQNIETVKCFDASKTVNRRFGLLTEALEGSWLDLHRQKMTLGTAAATVFAVSVAGSFFLALGAVERGTLSVGGFVLSTVYILQLVRPIEALGASARDIGQAIEFIEPVLGILRLPVEGAASTPGARARSPAAAPIDIHLQGVLLSYGAAAVLRDLDLHVRAGETLAVVGPSGSGKSSLARLLLGLVKPDAGQLLIGQESIEQFDPADLRAMIGYVPQDIVLFDDTIEANVSIARPEATRRDVEDACRAARVHDFIQSLPAGYDTRVGGRGLKLSGGERQRIAIARAILKASPIYLFDEATSALDGLTESDIVADLRRICAGRTTILITHRLSVARHADRVALLKSGRIVELGTHSELMALSGGYARMHRLQATAGTDDVPRSGRTVQT